MPPICHECEKLFSTDPKQLPLLLSCGHTYCAWCINKFAKCVHYSGNITCPACGETHYVESAASLKQLPINHHIYGLVTSPTAAAAARNGDGTVDSVAMIRDLSGKLEDLLVKKPPDKTTDLNTSTSESTDSDIPTCELCCECHSEAEVHCPDCQQLYCGECCTQVHKLVALKSHKQGPLPVKPLYPMCPLHPGKVPVEAVAGVPVCPVCPPGPDDPDPVPLVVSESSVEQLGKRARTKLDRLKESDRRIGLVIPQIQCDFKRVRSQTRINFAYFHGLLQTRENELLQELETAQANTLQSLLDIRYEIARTTALHNSNVAWLKKHAKNEKLLWSQQRKVQDIVAAVDSAACMLERQGDDRRLMIQCKGEMMKHCIREVCRLQLSPAVHQYTLRGEAGNVMTSSSPEEVVPTSPPEMEASEGGVAGSSTNISIFSNVTEDNSVIETGDVVTVSTLHTPHSFYVQKQDNLRTIDEQRGALNRYYGSSSKDDHVKDCTVGEMVCAQFSEDGMFYRARIISYNPAEATAEVLYIDYGNGETLPLARIYPLARQFTLCPGLSLHCSFYELVPRGGGEEWSAECLKAFNSITEGKRFFLVIKGDLGGQRDDDDDLNSDVQQVDLRGEDIPSAREFLIFLEHAEFEGTPPPLPATSPWHPVTPTWLKWPTPEVESFVLVEMTFAVGPADFKVIPHSHSPALASLTQELEVYMAAKGRCYKLRHLSKGTMCIARFAEDDQFYRAVVVGACGTLVTIRYCDYGNEVEVPHGDLYEIPDHLALPPGLALPCSLAGVEPSDGGKSWSEGACMLFQKLTYDKKLFAELISLDEEGRHVIKLIDTTQSDMDIDIAKHLVETGVARLTAEMLQLPEIVLGEIDSTHEVTLRHFVSPSSFYVVKDITHCNRFHRQLHEAYAAAYTSDQLQPVIPSQCAVGDVAVTRPKGLFSRVRVIALSSPETVRVSLVDDGRECEVPRSSLLSLQTGFSLRDVPAIAVPCSLAGVRPDDGERWSEEACRGVKKWLAQKIAKEGRKLHLTVVSLPEDGVWGVDAVLLDLKTGSSMGVADELIGLGYGTSARDTTESCYQSLEMEEGESSGVIINVDPDCTLFFRPDTITSHLPTLERALSAWNPDPNESVRSWVVGSPCVARFRSRYRRGLVSRIMNPSFVEVTFVDMGIRESITITELYDALLCPEVPCLAVPLRLARVEPDWTTCADGTWTKKVASHLYEEAVNEKCTVNVLGQRDGCYNATIRLEGGVDVGSWLISNDYAVSTEF